MRPHPRGGPAAYALSVLAVTLLTLLLIGAAGAALTATPDQHESQEDQPTTIPVVDNDAGDSSPPEIAYTSTATATDASGPWLVTVDGVDFHAFENVDDIDGQATTLAGWSSLATSDPADVAYTGSDKELVSVTGTENVAYEVYGETDGSTVPFQVHEAGALIGNGTLDVLNVVVDRNESSPDHGEATGYGQITLAGPTGASFYEEVAEVTCGTGVLWFEMDTFTPTTFSDPEIFETEGRIQALGFQVTSVTQAQHGQVTIDAGGTTLTYTPDPGFDGADTFDYTITDCQGATSTATVNLTVLGDEDPPTSAFEVSPNPIDLGETTTITDASFDPEGEIVACDDSWTKIEPESGIAVSSSTPSCPTTVDKTPSDPGIWRFCRTVEDAAGLTDQACQEVHVLTIEPVDASFELNRTVVNASEPILATDTSTGEITSCSWSEERLDPPADHSAGGGGPGPCGERTSVFDTAGIWEICMNLEGFEYADPEVGLVTVQDEACRTVDVLGDPLTAGFELDTHELPEEDPVTATDTSLGAKTACTWDTEPLDHDGDGETFAADGLCGEETFTFGTPGTWRICQTVEGTEYTDPSVGVLETSDTACEDITVTEVNDPPVASFTAPEQVLSLDEASFQDTSTDEEDGITAWAWTLGDGNESQAQHPTHTYQVPATYQVCLTVTDDGGLTDTACNDIEVLNRGPSAGFDMPAEVTTSEEVAPVDTSTDPDGQLGTWSWTLGDGRERFGPAPAFTYVDDGTYEVCLTVTDDHDASDTLCQAITVTNRAPSVGISPVPSTHTLTDLTFEALAQDPDGVVTTLAWTFGDGHTSELEAPAHHYQDDGTYEVCLTVTDDDGAMATDCQEVTILNRAPTPSINGPTEVLTLEEATFHAELTDPDGEVTSWTWTSPWADQEAGTTLTHTFQDDGTLAACLIATDDDGAEGSVCHTIEVLNRPPELELALPATLLTLEDLQPGLEATDPDGSILQETVTWGDGTTSEQAPFEHAYQDDGRVEVCYTATDDDEATTTTCGTVEVLNRPPEPAFSHLPTVPTNLDTIAFTDESLDPDGEIVAWSWDLGDGNTSTLRSPDHRYAWGGTYTVTLTVTDDDGATATLVTDLEVIPVIMHARASATHHLGDGAAAVPGLADTGELVTERAAEAEASTASVDQGTVAVAGAESHVRTELAQAEASSTIAQATVELPGIGTLELRGLDVQAGATCQATTGTMRLATLTLNGLPLGPGLAPAPNTAVELPGQAELVLNHQAVDEEGRFTTSAVLLDAPGIGRLALGYAEAWLENCPGTVPQSDGLVPLPSVAGLPARG